MEPTKELLAYLRRRTLGALGPRAGPSENYALCIEDLLDALFGRAPSPALECATCSPPSVQVLFSKRIKQSPVNVQQNNSKFVLPRRLIASQAGEIDPKEDLLVQKCKRGDSAAAEALVDRFWNRVFALSFRLTVNTSDAEDLTQETFLRAFRTLDNYRPDGQFKAWLFRIATNLFLDEKKAMRTKAVITSNDLSLQAGTDTQSPELAFDRSEMLAILWKAIGALSKEQQVVIMLRAVEHLDYPEIASILGVKESTARWHMYEARRILRQMLEREYDLEGLAHDA